MYIQEYPIIKDKWVMKPYKMLFEHETDYEIHFVDQFKKDQDWCEVTVAVQKQYEDYDDGVVFDGSITSGFKIKGKKRNVTPELLFDLIKVAGLNFAKSFAELIKGTSLEGTKINKPEFEMHERKLQRIIDNSE